MPDTAQLLEQIAGQLHALAFDVGEYGTTDAARIEARRIAEAIVSAVEEGAS